jgi:hypothetical protein
MTLTAAITSCDGVRGTIHLALSLGGVGRVGRIAANPVDKGWDQMR